MFGIVQKIYVFLFYACWTYFFVTKIVRRKIFDVNQTPYFFTLMKCVVIGVCLIYLNFKFGLKAVYFEKRMTVLYFRTKTSSVKIDSS